MSEWLDYESDFEKTRICKSHVVKLSVRLGYKSNFEKP
jgi:hypothetical protein